MIISIIINILIIIVLIISTIKIGEIIEHFEKSIDELDKSLNYTKEL